MQLAEQRREFRRKLRQSVDAMSDWLEEAVFDATRSIRLLCLYGMLLLAAQVAYAWFFSPSLTPGPRLTLICSGILGICALAPGLRTFDRSRYWAWRSISPPLLCIEFFVFFVPLIVIYVEVRASAMADHQAIQVIGIACTACVTLAVQVAAFRQNYESAIGKVGWWALSGLFLCWVSFLAAINVLLWSPPHLGLSHVALVAISSSSVISLVFSSWGIMEEAAKCDDEASAMISVAVATAFMMAAGILIWDSSSRTIQTKLWLSAGVLVSASLLTLIIEGALPSGIEHRFHSNRLIIPVCLCAVICVSGSTLLLVWRPQTIAIWIFARLAVSALSAYGIYMFAERFGSIDAVRAIVSVVGLLICGAGVLAPWAHMIPMPNISVLARIAISTASLVAAVCCGGLGSISFVDDWGLREIAIQIAVALAVLTAGNLMIWDSLAGIGISSRVGLSFILCVFLVSAIGLVRKTLWLD
jgi:hypothetical protein